jgi:hypothetical protein
LESDKFPPIAAFCQFSVRLYTPNLNNLGAKSPIVSGLHLKYSRFSETTTGDRARSALRPTQLFLRKLYAASLIGSAADWQQRRWVVRSMPVLRTIVRLKLFPRMSNAICHRAIGTPPEAVAPLRHLAAKSLARAMRCGRPLRRDFDV